MTTFPQLPPTRLRVRRPADFLALIPYLLGFHPADSVVAVLSRRGRVLLTARMDLPPTPLAGQLASHLGDLTTQHAAEELVLVAYGDDLDRARAVLERLVLEAAVPVREALRVGRGRWWSLTCSTGCCPAEGTAYDPGSHPLAAEAVYAGLSAQADRSSLQLQVIGPDAQEAARLAGPLAAAQRKVAALGRPAAAGLMADTVRRCRDDPDGPDEADCLLLAALARDLVVRDVAWAMMSRDDGAEHLRVWSRVVARAPLEVASAPLGLLGAAAWICGNGALQNCCVERLEEVDPGYTLGALLADISDRALSPSTWDEMAEELRREVSAVAAGRRLY